MRGGWGCGRSDGATVVADSLFTTLVRRSNKGVHVAGGLYGANLVELVPANN